MKLNVFRIVLYIRLYYWVKLWLALFILKQSVEFFKFSVNFTLKLKLVMPVDVQCIKRKILLEHLPPFYVKKQITLYVSRTDISVPVHRRRPYNNYSQINFRNASGVKRKPTGHTQRVVSLNHSTENTINKIQVW